MSTTTAAPVLAYRCGCPMDPVRGPRTCPLHGVGWLLTMPETFPTLHGPRAGAAITPAPQGVTIPPPSHPQPPSPLTNREEEIAELVWRGMSDQAIAMAVEVSPYTVRSHLSNIAAKLPGPGTPRRKIFYWYHSQPRGFGEAYSSEVKTLRHGIAFIYFLEAEGCGRIKVGIAIEPYTRIRQIQGHSPVLLRLLGFVRGTYEEEQAILARFAHLRVHGEWFDGGEDLRAFIDTVLSEPPAELIA